MKSYLVAICIVVFALLIGVGIYHHDTTALLAAIAWLGLGSNIFCRGEE